MPMRLRDGSIYAPVESQHMILRDGKSVDAIHASLYNNLSSSHFYWPDSRGRVPRYYYDRNGVMITDSGIIPQALHQPSTSTFGYVLDAISQITQRFTSYRSNTDSHQSRRYSSPERSTATQPPSQGPRRYSSPQKASARHRQTPSTERLNSVKESQMITRYSSRNVSEHQSTNLTSTPNTSVHDFKEMNMSKLSKVPSVNSVFSSNTRQHSVHLSSRNLHIDNDANSFRQQASVERISPSSTTWGSVSSANSNGISNDSLPKQNSRSSIQPRETNSRTTRSSANSLHSFHDSVCNSHQSFGDSNDTYLSGYSPSMQSTSSYEMSEEEIDTTGYQRFPLASNGEKAAISSFPRWSIKKKVSSFFKKSSALFAFASSSSLSKLVQRRSYVFDNDQKDNDVDDMYLKQSEFSTTEMVRCGKSFTFIAAMFALIFSKYFVSVTNYLEASKVIFKSNLKLVTLLLSKIFKAIFGIPKVLFRENPLFKRFSRYQPARKVSSTDICRDNTANNMRHFFKGFILFCRYLPFALSIIFLWKIYIHQESPIILNLDIPNSNKLDLRFGNNLTVWHISPSPKQRMESKLFDDGHSIIIHLRDHTTADMLHRVNVLKVLSDASFHVIVPVRPIPTIEFVNLWSAIVKSTTNKQPIYIWSDISNSDSTIAYARQLNNAGIIPDGVIMETKIHDSSVRNLEIWKGGNGKHGNRSWNFLKCPLFVPSDCKETMRQEIELCVRAISVNTDFKTRSYNV